MPISLHHLRVGEASRWAVRGDAGWAWLDGTLADLLAMPLDETRAMVTAAADKATGDSLGDGPLPPVDRQEVWAAGVTYQRSRAGPVRDRDAGAAGRPGGVRRHHLDLGDGPRLRRADRLVVPGAELPGRRGAADRHRHRAGGGLHGTAGGHRRDSLPGSRYADQ